MSVHFEMEPIGYVTGGRALLEDDDWGEVAARIVLDPAVVESTTTAGLDGFSHVEVIYVFDRVAPDAVCRGSRHPRGRLDWPDVGILAQRAKDRPNRIGVTVCRLAAADETGLDVIGLDAVEGTPILDVKPYMSGFGPRGDLVEPEWARELMAGYW
nr:SAM-dependent methyltransferase [Desertimonas flava]